jgi:cyclic pyranopterin phosphate synthase
VARTGTILDEEAYRLANHDISAGMTHINDSGKAAMVNVGAKSVTRRTAVAKGSVVMQAATLKTVKENAIEKGDVLGVARIAGIMGAKSTSQLIPLCHPLPLDKVEIKFRLDEERSLVEIETIVETQAKTGVEMEALTAVSVAALAIYDMVKAIDRRAMIDGIKLVRKTGGKSGDIELE